MLDGEICTTTTTTPLHPHPRVLCIVNAEGLKEGLHSDMVHKHIVLSGKRE